MKKDMSICCFCCLEKGREAARRRTRGELEEEGTRTSGRRGSRKGGRRDGHLVDVG
jgi:hypothetical protein